MVVGMVKKIMLTGIDKYAKIYDATSVQVQIKVTNQVEGTVNYEMCKEFKSIDKIRFLDILDKKIDIFQYESLANPFLKKSLIQFSIEVDDDIDNVSCYIVQYLDKEGGKQIGLKFFNGSKNIKNISLVKHLEQLGL
jgi:hypothetical protein